MCSRRLWRRGPSCRLQVLARHQCDREISVLRSQQFAEDTHSSKLEGSKHWKQLQVSFLFKSFAIMRACCTVVYRLIDVICRVRPAKFFLRCVVHVSLT